jgi:hypothetical protein
MLKEEHPSAGAASYGIGNIGPNARVAIGEHITWTEGFSGNPAGEELKRTLPYRPLVVGKPTHLTVDSPAVEDQVQPLPLGIPTCVVLVVSRAGTAGREGPEPPAIGLLGLETESKSLLVRHGVRPQNS